MLVEESVRRVVALNPDMVGFNVLADEWRSKRGVRKKN